MLFFQKVFQKRAKEGFAAPIIAVSTVAGSTSSGTLNGTRLTSLFYNPTGVTVDSSGNLYVSDTSNHRIRKITPDGIVSTFSGSSAGFVDGQVTVAKFNNPNGITIDSSGNLYIADRNNNRIRKIDTSGNVTTIAGSTYGFADGQGTNAKFAYPRGITIDSSGNLYVTDSNNHRIRKITPDGIVSTFSGSSAGFADGQGTVAKFNLPVGITIDSSGNLYVSDTSNHVIRKISPSGSVSTVAGFGTLGSTDGQGGSARFTNPQGVAIDNSGNLYVADTGNHKIRKIDTSKNVTTIAGSGTAGFADGQGTVAKFNGPIGITIDSSGILYIGDYNNNKIRKIGLTCGPGSQLSNGDCVSCAPGTYGIDGLSCTPCAAGKTSVAGSTLASACTSCAAGTSSAAGSTCSPCAAGTYSGVGSASCTPCAAGTTSVTGASTCTTCAAGRFSAAGASSCSICAAGTYSGAGAASCTPCAAGTTSVAGATSASACTTCTAGTFSAAGASSCSTCAAGTFSAAGSSSCSTCAAGRFSAAGASACSTCAAGTSSGAGASACTSCAAGSYSAAGASSCASCPTNATCPTTTDFTCNTGYTKSGSSCQQITCGVGKYVNGSICTDCTAGQFSSGGTATSCSSCAAGTFSGAGSGSCLSCAAGTFSGAGSGSCTSCAAGSYSGAGASSCTSCGSGSTSPAGSTSAAACSCSANSYMNNGQCITCPVGLVSPAGSTSAEACSCSANSYMNNGQCITCPVGLVSPAGSTSASACGCPTGQSSVTLNGVTKCVASCPTLTKPPMSQGSDKALLFALSNCAANTFNYNNNGVMQTTNPCTNSFYDFDKQACVNAVGTNPIGCSSSTVYDTATNACVPVRTIVKPGDPQLINTTGSPSQGDFTGCKTVDQGDCTILFKDSLGNPITANPCTANNQLYNFATKTCVAKTKKCCNYTDPVKAVADKSCAADTSLIITKNTALCPATSRTLCCNKAYATNTTCIRNKFWTPSYQFTAANRAKCATGFQDYTSDYQGMHLLNQKKAKMNRKI